MKTTMIKPGIYTVTFKTSNKSAMQDTKDHSKKLAVWHIFVKKSTPLHLLKLRSLGDFRDTVAIENKKMFLSLHLLNLGFNGASNRLSINAKLKYIGKMLVKVVVRPIKQNEIAKSKDLQEAIKKFNRLDDTWLDF